MPRLARWLIDLGCRLFGGAVELLSTEARLPYHELQYSVVIFHIVQIYGYPMLLPIHDT